MNMPRTKVLFITQAPKLKWYERLHVSKIVNIKYAIISISSQVHKIGSCLLLTVDKKHEYV
jgi:hypothetical protein